MRTRLLPLLLVLVAALALPWGGAPAQEPGGPVIRFNPEEVRSQVTGSPEETSDQTNLAGVYRYIQAYLKASTTEERQQIVNELSDFCIQRGLRPAPDVAEIFLYLAAEARGEGRTDDYRRLVNAAETFDPDNPAVHLALAAVARKQGGLFSGAFVFETLNAFILAFQHPISRPVALANLGIWVRITGFLLLGVLSLLMFLRYQGLLRHDVHEWLGGQDQPWNHALGWAVLFLPSLLFLSGFWWCAYWAGVFLLYGRNSEKFVLVLAAALFAASGVVASYTSQGLYLTQSPPHVSNLRCYQNRIDIGADTYLAPLATSQDPQRDTYAFLLASRYLLHGNYLKAEELYKALLVKDPSDAAVANNLGCILCYEGRYQEAIVFFTKAIEARPNLAAAHFNRGLARTKIFNFSEAKEDQEKARAIDRTFLSRHRLTKQEDWGPVAEFLPPKTTLDMAVAQEAERVGRTGLPKRPSLGWFSLLVRPPFGLAVPVFVLVFLGVALTKKRSAFAKACFKCGRPYCSRCKTSLEFESHCGQCVHLYIKQDGVSPEARMKKNYEVEQHNKFVRIMRAALSVLAPGAGHFVEGRPFSSLFLLALWCGFVAAFFLKAFALPLPGGISAAPLWSAYAVVGSLLMLLLWLSFGLPRALSRELPRPYAGS